jgi:hypothetical protein
MKRRALCALAVLAACCVLVPGALASTGHRRPPGATRTVQAGARSASLDAGRAAAAGARPAALGADPTYSISGHVYDFNKAPVTGARVDWGWWDSTTDYQWGGWNLDATPDGTGADGAFAFPAVLGGHQVNGVAADDLHVYYNPFDVATYSGLEEMASFVLDFQTGNSFDLQPAHVVVTAVGAPAATVEVRAGNASVGFARADVPLTAGSGVASVLPMMAFNDVVGYAYHTIAPGLTSCVAQVEQSFADVSVGAGALAPATVNLDWAQAQYAYLAGPTCRHSGKSGTTVTMVLRGWPAAEQPQFIGYSDTAAFDYGLGTPRSPGASTTFTVPLKIASTPGLYEIDTSRTDDPASLVGMWDYFQVCAFKASSSTIRRGGTVRLSGMVPAAAGKVTLYSTAHKVAGQPKSLAAKGWTKLGAYTVASRKFATGLLHPRRTTWYVVRYTGYAFPAFTSVVKVAVR